jgi:hypothetical protein
VAERESTVARFDVSSLVKPNKVTGAIQMLGDSTIDVEVTADGNTTLFQLLKNLCSEVVLKDAPVPDPAHPTPEWDALRTVPANGTVVTLVLGMRGFYKS